MLTVVVYINDLPVLARSCRNVGPPPEKDDGFCCYNVDDGRIIRHKRTDGAARLAIQLLKGIKEP